MAVIDEPSGDEEGGVAVDAAPRPRRQAKKGTALRVAVVLVLVVGALGFLLYKGLGDSATFFYNVDEAVERQDELGTDRFRMQGTVLDGTVEETPDGVTFTVFYDGTEAEVVHRGDPPELFQPDIPVVIEGAWDGERFASDRIIVKHSSEYQAENGDRLDDAEDEDAPASQDSSGGSEDPASS